VDEVRRAAATWRVQRFNLPKNKTAGFGGLAAIQTRRGMTALAGLANEFAADAAPVPGVLTIAASAGEVQQDASETGLGEVEVHRNLVLLVYLLAESHNEETGVSERLARLLEFLRAA